MKGRIVIVDYDMGNLFSVQQACENTGLQAVISNTPSVISSASAIILPGVGSFIEAMTHLKDMGLIGPLMEAADRQTPMLGICLGMQLLFTSSEEFGSTPGLGFIKGEVRKFPSLDPDGARVKIPQINWNHIYPPAGKSEFDCDLLRGIPEKDSLMYFVHSYYVVNEEPLTTACVTDYAGITYCSGVSKNNIKAFQFHPEKSAADGLRIYANFKNSIENGAI